MFPVQGSSAVGAAVVATALTFSVAVVAAPVSAVLLPFVPVPGLLLGGRHGERALGACAVLTALLTGVVLGGQPAVTYLLVLGVPTLTATIGLRRQWSVERTVLVSAAAWTCAVIGLTLVAFGSPAALIEGLHEHLRESFDLAVTSASRLGVQEETAADLLAARDGVLVGILEVLPGVLVLIGGLTMLLNVLIARAVLPWLRASDLRAWSAPPQLIWALIAAGFAIFAPVPAVGVIARNAFVVLIGCYFCQGLAIVSFYLSRFQVRRGLRVFTYVLLLTQQVLVLLVVTLGIFDLWANFRRIGLAAAVRGDD